MSVSQTQPQGSLDNYKPALKERGELDDLKKKVEARIKELDADLRPILEGRGAVMHDTYSFECRLSAGRKTLDKEKMVEFLAEHGYVMADFEKEGAPFTTMTVKRLAVV